MAENMKFREFDEDDEMAFGVYEPDARISDDILLFEIKKVNYIARVIISRFKVIIEAISEYEMTTSDDIESKLDNNITLVHEALTKGFAVNIANHLFDNYYQEDDQINGEDLLVWGFKIL